MITQEYLKDLFEYDPETGWFTNRFSRGRAKEGARAGAETGHGYRRIIIDYAKYYEHHLAWLYIYGEWPEELDHKNGDRSCNTIENLRKATRKQNCHNSERETGESGLKGAYLDHRVQRWYSKIQLGCQVKWLGHFDSAEEAHKAYLAAAEIHQGEFALHNRPQENI